MSRPPEVPAELPAEMRVIEIAAPGGPEVLRPGRRRVPPAQRALALLVRREHSRPDIQRGRRCGLG